ncbi:hypothetical protein LTR50_000800 [Elasticomyces elasticus]|nr:hypothetical protein LTR50_000800 [Elasticomyces elasticus]
MSSDVASTLEPSGNNRRFPRRNLRQSTFILPKTGERVRRVFTLRGSSSSDCRQNAGDVDESTPLIRSTSFRSPEPGTWTWQRWQRYARDISQRSYDCAVSKTGQGVLKCSLAYLLGSLATFVPFISGLVGKQDGKHIVATVTVYFHPARSVGSMHEATLLAFIAFLYAAFISFTSMVVSVFFDRQHLLVLGHAIVLVVFCGGGLGFVAWLKQRLGNPLVNVACSLASLVIISILTREGAIQTAKFSFAKIVQVLVMVVMGVFATTLVNLVVSPVSARKELNSDFAKITDLVGDMLIVITRTFLSGDEAELQEPIFKQITKDHKTQLNSLKKNLSEARWEHYVLGTEKQYNIEAKLVQCLQRLSQNIGGLRSAAFTQFSLIRVSLKGDATPVVSSLRRQSISILFDPPRKLQDGLTPITEAPDDAEDEDWNRLISSAVPNSSQAPHSPAEVFTTFIAQLGPPMKSLAYTLKQILDELPFGSGPGYDMVDNTNFRSSLETAIALFKEARKEALDALYQTKELSEARSLEVVAEIEEVAASCGHFSFSLLDFAEDMLVYLDILEDLKHEVERSPRRRSWKWLFFWRGQRAQVGHDKPNLIQQSDEHALSHDITSPIQNADTVADPEKVLSGRPYTYRLWRAMRVLRRDDVRFAIKVGVGAALFALPSFMASTRPIYSHWRGEWGLVSYMVVCSMTIGASNTTGLERLLGTGIGAISAIVAWIASGESPWLLGFFGWLVALGCFYVIVGQGKGPMGRFILLTYNLSALYAYSLSVKDADGDDDDEGGINPEIWEIVLHRVVAVMAGCIWAIVITRLIFPISARRKLMDGLCILWLRMSLIWKRDPLAMFLLGEPQSSYMDIREETELHSFLQYLETLRKSAAFEFELKGPFPDKTIGRILECTARMLDAFHAMNVVIMKDLKASPGETELLRYTQPERYALSARISHLVSFLASSMKLEYPLNDVLPSIEHTRDRLLAKVFEFRKSGEGRALATEQDYELLYAYGTLDVFIVHTPKKVFVADDAVKF